MVKIFVLYCVTLALMIANFVINILIFIKMKKR